MQFRPIDHDGNPILAYVEKPSLERKIAVEEPLQSEKSSDCKGGKSCKDNLCQHLETDALPL